MKDFALIILAYNYERLSSFLSHFPSFQLGVDSVDIFFIHNAWEVESIKNRSVRSDEEIGKVSELLRKFPVPKVVIERENVGEDMGAYHFAFNLLKDQYRYFFFLNEAATIKKDRWLLPYKERYEANDNIVAASPMVCTGIQYSHCMPTTYWSLRTSFGKEMNWPKPLSRADAEIQEMELVYPQAKAKGRFIAQVGVGFDIVYKNSQCCGEGIY